MRVFKVGPKMYTVHVDMYKRPLDSASDADLPVGGIRRTFNDRPVGGRLMTALDQIKGAYSGHPIEIVEEYVERGGTVPPPTGKQKETLDKLTGQIKENTIEVDTTELKALTKEIKETPSGEAFVSLLPIEPIEPTKETATSVLFKEKEKSKMNFYREFVLQKLTQAKLATITAKGAKEKNFQSGVLEGIKRVAIEFNVITEEEIKEFLNE